MILYLQALIFARDVLWRLTEFILKIRNKSAIEIVNISVYLRNEPQPKQKRHDSLRRQRVC